MKLVDILARELKVWPEGVDSVWQSSFDNEIYFDADVRPFYTSLNAEDSGDRGAVITQAEWQAAVDSLNAPKVVEWDEVGLPPVGLDVEIKRGNCTWIDGDEWQIGKTATVMASFLNSRDIEMASVQFPGGHCECILARCLSPIRTADQVADEEREKAAKELYMTINWDSKPGTWENLLQARRDDYRKAIDAGYRKEPIPCGS